MASAPPDYPKKKVGRQLKHQDEEKEVTGEYQVRDAAEWERDLDALIHVLAREQKANRLPIIGEIFRTASKLAMESTGTLNLKIAATSLKELRYSFKMFFPHRSMPKITMFGSARVPPATPLYEYAKEFAQAAVKRKFMVITGGGPGIMAAGNEGAEGSSGFGLNIRLPVEQTANPFIEPTKMLIHYKYFFTRKLFLVKEAAAFAFFPGGFGTFDEAFEVLTLLQTGKSNLIPVVLVEPKGFGFWEPAVKHWKDVLLKHGFISESDFNLFRVFNSIPEALDHIDHFYSKYHSTRFVRELAVMRLKGPLSDAKFEKIHKDFKFLVSEGGVMKQGGPLPEEANEPELDKLARLYFPFDRRDFGGLRKLIDAINA